MKTLREYIDLINEVDGSVPARPVNPKQARVWARQYAQTHNPDGTPINSPAPAASSYDAVADTIPQVDPSAEVTAAPTSVTPPQAAPATPAPPSRGTYAQNGPVGDAVDAIKNWWNAPKPAQPPATVPVARATPAPQGQGAAPATPGVDPKVAALQKEIQNIQANIQAYAKDPNAVRDFNVQLYGAQSDLAKLTGQPAPKPVAGSTAAYGNPTIAKQGQQQQINKGQEELRVAQASGDQAAAQTAQAKIDQATTNKADITFADADTPYGTKSGKNLTPSTGSAPQKQGAAPTPAPAKPAAPVIPPAQLKKWQGVLNAEGYPTTADGQWGPATQKAVRDFQVANGLPATGQIDKTTSDALNSFAATPVAGASQLRTTVTPASESMSRTDKALLEKMLSIAGLR